MRPPSRLKDLKARLDADDPARDEAFFAKQRAEKAEAKTAQRDLAERQKEELSAADARAPRLAQRGPPSHTCRATRPLSHAWLGHCG